MTRRRPVWDDSRGGVPFTEGDEMEVLLVILGLILVVEVAVSTVVLVMAIHDAGRRVDILAEETRNLRLKSRARVTTASIQSGPLSEEAELRRVGRHSTGRRKVVGGDPDSEQRQNLERQGGGGDADADD